MASKVQSTEQPAKATPPKAEAKAAPKVYQLGEGSETDTPQGAALPPVQIAEDKDSKDETQAED